MPDRASKIQKFSVEDELQSLLERNRGRETGHFQELVVAFAGGGISLVALLTVLRICNRAPAIRVIEAAEVAEESPQE